MRFGVRQFELALMHRMRDLDAARVEDALQRMGATRAELRAAHTQWTAMGHSARAPKGRALFRMALGPPADEGVHQAGSLTCDVARWRLPSWPDLRFEVLLGPGGEVWNQWFVRPGHAKALSFADLVPWSCVVADVGDAFPGASHLEGSAPHHWTVGFTHEGTRYHARFVYGLYQRLDRGDDESPARS
ncbi:hypothetical protein EDD27_2726 [Nonomuraea polychroma]|uniref:Uncharacterized protein n=1 Tax=Nonomuraea polychroma TaxID=46176 RepID=A0A438M3V3_9ACTN|nr:hypothetical protein [Nonomuraea polychroma]RVX40321.1 hypothetical protein EDD27_2726 [Nonomuraea polychroma]